MIQQQIERLGEQLQAQSSNSSLSNTLTALQHTGWTE